MTAQNPPKKHKNKISFEALIHNHTTPNNREEGGWQRYVEIEEVAVGKAGPWRGRGGGRIWVGSGTLDTRKMKAFFGGEGGETKEVGGERWRVEGGGEEEVDDDADDDDEDAGDPSCVVLLGWAFN